MPAKTCQYGNCLEDVGERGLTVSLKTPTFGGEVRAIYCCASHAAMGLARLAVDRKEAIPAVIRNDDGSQTEGAWLGELPRHWRTT